VTALDDFRRANPAPDATRDETLSRVRQATDALQGILRARLGTTPDALDITTMRAINDCDSVRDWISRSVPGEISGSMTIKESLAIRLVMNRLERTSRRAADRVR